MNSGRALVLLLALAIVAIAAIAFFTLSGNGPVGPDRPSGPEPGDESGERPDVPNLEGAERVAVSGTVIRRGALSPVADAEVTLGDDIAKTDRDGRFTLSEAPVGSFSIRIRAEGAVDLVKKLEITKETTELGEFLVGYPTVLKGQVVGADARPVAAAKIRVLEYTRYQAGRWYRGPDEDQIRMGIELLDEGKGIPGETYGVDGEGRFRIEGLSPGRYFVSASAEGLTSVGKEKVELPAGGEAEVKLELGEGATISGTVVDTANRPVDGAVVLAVTQGDAVDLPYAVMERTVTTAGGKFAFDSLVNGMNYLIFACAPDGQIGTGIQIPAPTTDQKIKVGTRFTVFGTVVDDESGDALEGVVVYGILARDESDEGGRFELDGMIRQNPFPQIWVRADGYEDTAINLKLGLLEQLTASKVERNIRLTKLVPATLRVTVRDSNGNPVAAAKVVIRHWGEEEDLAAGTSDDSGVATIEGVPPRGVLVLASKEGYVQATVRSGRSGEPMAHAAEYTWASADPGQIQDVALTMIRVGKAGGTVRDRSGNPLAGVVLSTNAGKLGQTDEKGNFSVEGVPEGMRTSVQFRKPGYVDQWQTFEAVQRTGIEVVMSRGGTLAGIVVDEAGKPVGGANVAATVTPENWSEQMVKTDAEGRFRIEGLTPQKYMLTVNRDGFAPVRSATIELAEAQTVDDLKITLAKGIRISLKLLHPGGQPVDGSILIYGPLGNAKSERHLRQYYVRTEREMVINIIPGLYRVLGSPNRTVTDAGATEYEHQINAAGELRVELKADILRLLLRPNLPEGTRVGSVMLTRTEPEEPNVRFWFNDEEDGVFQSPAVPPGKYTLGFWFRRPAADSWEYKEVQGLEPGPKVLDVDLK